MPTITRKGIRQARSYSNASGNAWKQRFNLTTTATGVMTDGDATAAIGNGDVVRLGILPAGLELHDALAIVSDAFAATTTGKIGFAYVDGVDSTAVPQDDDYFFTTSLSLASAGRTRANNTAIAPVVLPKEAYLILTNGAAAQNVVGVLDVVVEGVLVGV